MRRTLSLVVGAVCLFVLGSTLISPATYVIVVPNMASDSAVVVVNGGRARSIVGILGVYALRVAETEGSAIITTQHEGNKRERCSLGYFTSMEIQPRVLGEKDCVKL